MSKTLEQRHIVGTGNAVIDPKARLDAWERARGALTKPRMQKVLQQLRIVRREWARAFR